MATTHTGSLYSILLNYHFPPGSICVKLLCAITHPPIPDISLMHRLLKSTSIHEKVKNSPLKSMVVFISEVLFFLWVCKKIFWLYIDQIYSTFKANISSMLMDDDRLTQGRCCTLLGGSWMCHSFCVCGFTLQCIKLADCLQMLQNWAPSLTAV